MIKELGEFTLYQGYGLKKLISYRKKFYLPEPAAFGKTQPKKSKEQLIEEFIDTFCAHNFADSDYSVIQQELIQFDTMEEWIYQASVSTILKCFTYFIWTDKIVDGYFKARIDNHIVDQLLLRLEAAIKEEHVAV